MTLEEIRWITVLFDTEKMSRAAEQLYVSQPALSQCLQRVERELGFRLFSRSNRGLVPTEKGRLFYQTAVTISAAYGEFLTKAELLDLPELREFTIGMPPYLSSRASTDVLMQLKKHFPHISFFVHEARAAELEAALRKNEVQLMVTSEPMTPQGMVPHPIAQISTVIFLRAGSEAVCHSYTENGRRYLNPIYLKEEPISITKPGQASRMLAENVFRECGIEPRIRHETSHISTLYKNARAGITSAIGPCTQQVDEMDIEDSIIYYIPASYQWSKAQVLTYALPEIDKRIPKAVFQILRETIDRSGVYVSID